jgi:hypothetical protein
MLSKFFLKGLQTPVTKESLKANYLKGEIKIGGSTSCELMDRVFLEHQQKKLNDLRKIVHLPFIERHTFSQNSAHTEAVRSLQTLKEKHIQDKNDVSIRWNYDICVYINSEDGILVRIAHHNKKGSRAYREKA